MFSALMFILLRISTKSKEKFGILKSISAAVHVRHAIKRRHPFGCLLSWCGQQDSICILSVRNKMKVSAPSSRCRAAVHRTAAFDSFSSTAHKKTKGTLLGAFYHGAGNRTRTCTPKQWNLNPPSLPIPPCPRNLYILAQAGLLCQGMEAVVKMGSVSA